MQYNYVLSAALDCGTAVATLLVYFILQYPNHGTLGEKTLGSWWGNTVYTQTADARAEPLRHVAEGEYFGCVLGYAFLLVVLTVAPLVLEREPGSAALD